MGLGVNYDAMWNSPHVSIIFVLIWLGGALHTDIEERLHVLSHTHAMRTCVFHSR